MDCIAIVPARLHSRRFPGKLLSSLAGRPLIQHVVELCRATPGFDATVVASDDERILAAASEAGAEGLRITGEFASGTDRVAAAAQHYDAEAIVNVQGDEALLDPQALGRAVEAFRESGRELGTLRAPLREAADLFDPDVVKVVVAADGRALYFSRAPVPFPRQAWSRERSRPQGGRGGGGAAMAFDDIDPQGGPWWIHVGVYLYRRAALARWAALAPSPLERKEGLEQLRVLEAGERMHTWPVPEAAPAVNSPADLERARAALADRASQRQGAS